MSGHYLREAEIPARENWRKRSSSETTTSDLADFCKSFDPMDGKLCTYEVTFSRD